MSAIKQYREWQPDQGFLFSPSPHDWLEEGDLAYFILDVVDTLDLSAIESSLHAKDARGTRPHHPRMMTALLLYGYCTGVMSSRSSRARARARARARSAPGRVKSLRLFAKSTIP